MSAVFFNCSVCTSLCCQKYVRTRIQTHVYINIRKVHVYRYADFYVKLSLAFCAVEAEAPPSLQQQRFLRPALTVQYGEGWDGTSYCRDLNQNARSGLGSP